MNPAFMHEALDLARRGRGLASPNPMVGALLVRDGVVVGRGFHTYAGLHHAEIIALAQAGEQARGATMYLNLEPCSHFGRTPPCVGALIQAGVERVVAPLEDPNPLVAGEGFRSLREAGVEVEFAAEFAAAAGKLNEPFLHFMRTGRPLVTLKTAITLDGKISAPDDNRGWITSECARAHVQELRHDHDAILTGIGTLLADDCLLTDRTGMPRCRPLLRIVMDSQLRLPLDSKMARSPAGDLLVVTTSASSPDRRKILEGRGIRLLVFDGPGGRADLRSVVDWLGRERYLSLMIEAGSKMNWSALETGCVDRIFFYYGPKILGGLEALPLAGGIGRRRRQDAIRIHGVTIHPIPPDEFAVEGYVHGMIEELGAVESVETRAAGARIQVRCGIVTADMTEGASIAVNGVCLTALGPRPDSFSADMAPETLKRSNLGGLRAGSRVNLERPLSPTSRLSGHIVQGHVDATGEFLGLDPLGADNWWLRIRVPAELDPFLVYKGSIAIDGISLTIAALESDVLSVTIIPHTYRNTTLGGYRPGARVNLECDVLAKYVEKLLRKLDVKSPLSVEKLRENGY